MPAITIDSPAKLNLYLAVHRRRKDGYHTLTTLFHRVSLRDTLRLKKCRRGFSLTCSDPSLTVGEDNLISRAYRLLAERFPELGGVSVRLTKRIPVGGGLGGGSSNAAFFLLGMKKLYKLRIGLFELASLGRRLGADVPFFVYNVNQAVGRNLGDQLVPLASRGTAWFVLVVSNQGLRTFKVYRALRPKDFSPFLTRATRAVTMISNYLDREKYSQAGKVFYNDLEKAALRLRPSMKRIFADFAEFGITTARMSGSGPTVFAIFAHQAEARNLARKLRCLRPEREVVVCSTF